MTTDVILPIQRFYDTLVVATQDKIVEEAEGGTDAVEDRSNLSVHSTIPLSREDDSAFLRLLLSQTDATTAIEENVMDESESEELIWHIQQGLKKKTERKEDKKSVNDMDSLERILMDSSDSDSEFSDDNHDITLLTIESDQKESVQEKQLSKRQPYCSHAQYGFDLSLCYSHAEEYGFGDLCQFFLSTDSPLHSPDKPEPKPVNDELVYENDTKDNDEVWYHPSIGNILCGRDTIKEDEKTFDETLDETVDITASIGSVAIGDSIKYSNFQTNEEDKEEPNEGGEVLAPSAVFNQKTMTSHLIEVNKEEDQSELVSKEDLVLVEEIQFPFEQPREPFGLIMSDPDDDYLMQIQADPNGTSFCTNDDDDEEEEEKAGDSVEKESSKEETASGVHKEEFSARQHSESLLVLDPDGIKMLTNIDEEEAALSDCHILRNHQTNDIEPMQLEILTDDLVHEENSLSSSMWSQGALLDSDDSILGENNWEAYQEPDGVKFCDVMLSRQMENKVQASDETTSGKEQEAIEQKPFDEIEENATSQPSKILNKVVARAHGDTSSQSDLKTGLRHRLRLLERLKAIKDSDIEMLCACAQGCGDLSDSITFDEGSSQNGESIEHFSLD